MSSLSDKAQTEKGKALAADPQAAASKTTTKVTKKKDARMSQEQINSLIRCKTVYFPEDAIPKVSKERLAQTNLADQGNLPVPMDQMDDYIANIFRELNEMEARFMRERKRILNDYYTKGYAVEEVTTATPATPGRRRSRHGVTKQAAGKTKKLN